MLFDNRKMSINKKNLLSILVTLMFTYLVSGQTPYQRMLTTVYSHVNRESFDISNTAGKIKEINTGYDYLKSELVSPADFVIEELKALSNISHICQLHVNWTVKALIEQQPWAFKLLDSFGKFGAGLLDGNIYWVGSYPECINTTATVYHSINGTNITTVSHPFKGRYCKFGIPLEALPPVSDPEGGKPAIPIGELQIGLCVPDSCTAQDVLVAVNKEKHINVLAAVGIGFVCVVVGLPLWWKTTEVYRVALPYSAIDTLSKHQFEYTVDINVVSFVEMSATDLSSLSKHLMDSFNNNDGQTKEVLSTYKTSVREARQEEIGLLKASKTLKEFDSEMSKILQDSANHYNILLLPAGRDLGMVNPTLGLHRSVYVSYSKQELASYSREVVQVVKTVLVREATVIKGYNTAKGARNLKSDKESLRSVRSHPGYDVTLTLVSPQPDVLDVQWDIQQAVNAYLKPLVTAMDKYTTINVKSQVLFFTKVGTRQKKDPSTNEYFVSTQELPHMINPLESKLGSPASTNPDLNFLVYVPTRDQYPLYIRDDKGIKLPSNSFLSPQWGGIYIYNIAPPTVNDTLPLRPVLNMKHVMSVFITQLRLLLNMQLQTLVDVELLPVGNNAITQWEVDSWIRSRCVENLATSSASLESLSQLLAKISNIVINDDIGKQIELAVESMKKSHQLLLDGHLEEAFLYSSTAIVASEKAFFDPSLLELLYFPEDQKFAIYIPLFLPISFPVLASLWQAYKWWKSQGHTKPKKD